ncbi:MAG TPA: PEP-CTERM sorting domain-containing protein [Phycisphaerales bacterium]|nr:PEP-CTERM sorting domain-containing protein [Phycisphaerales bacterium]
MTKLIFVSFVLMMSLIAGSTLAVPVYSPGQITDEQIVINITAIGAAPEDSAADYRWYWSYDNRFPIEFEAVYGSADIADGSEWEAVSSVLDTWEAVPNASITSSLSSFDGDWGARNGDNELAWVESGWDSIGGFGFGPNTIAATVTWYYEDTFVQAESDIFFNGENFTWYTDTDDSGGEEEYIEHIALHELGHAFSLDDLYDPADMDRTMYGYSGYRDEDVALQTADAAALEYAYMVPEPATIAMLGLGSLALLRKRRA